MNSLFVFKRNGEGVMLRHLITGEDGTLNISLEPMHPECEGRYVIDAVKDAGRWRASWKCTDCEDWDAGNAHITSIMRAIDALVAYPDEAARFESWVRAPKGNLIFSYRDVDKALLKLNEIHAMLVTLGAETDNRARCAPIIDELEPLREMLVGIRLADINLRARGFRLEQERDEIRDLYIHRERYIKNEPEGGED